VAIVKHKYGHYFPKENEKELHKPHLHVYKVKYHHESEYLEVLEGEHATDVEHFFWEKHKKKRQEEYYNIMW
jgi:hypothetical protein